MHLVLILFLAAVVTSAASCTKKELLDDYAIQHAVESDDDPSNQVP